MVWRMMLFEELQDDYSVDGHLWYLSGKFKVNLGLHFALKTPISFMLRENIGWKMLFEEFLDGCL